MHDLVIRNGTVVEGMAAFITSARRKLFPLGDPPEYEPGPEASVQAIAEREHRSPQAVTYDLTLADVGRGLLSPDRLRRVRFDDRGLLAPGYLADVNVIDLDGPR